MKFISFISVVSLTTVLPFPATLFSAPDTAAKPAVEQEELKRLDVKNIQFSSWSRGLDIQFSDPVDAAELAKHIACDPEAKLTVATTGWGWCHRICGNFEPGKTYTISIDDTLAGTRTKALGRCVVHAFKAPDLGTSLEFLSDGKFFPLNASEFSLPITLVNAESVRIETREAYADCSAGFAFSPWNSDYSREIFSQLVKPPQTRNKNASFSVDLEKIGVPRRPGIYTVFACAENSYWTRTKRVLIVTDLAIQAVRNDNEIAVVLKNISENAVVPNAKISLYSRKKRLLAASKTDAFGFSRIELAPLADKEDEAALILAESGDDKTFFVFRNFSAQRQEYDFATGSREAYVFCERGICRPGEKISLFASLRDEVTKCARGGVPAEFAVTDPSGNVFVSIPVVGDSLGFYRSDFKVPAFAPTGSYRVKLRIPGQENAAFGRTSFSVSEYVPDTIELSVKSANKDGVVHVSGNAAYYFGLPLAQGDISLCREILFQDFKPIGVEFEGFEFGKEMPSALCTTDASLKIKSDDKGNFSADFENPKFDCVVTQPVLSVVSATASGAAGTRPVSAKTTTRIHYANYYFGTREKSADEGKRIFEICALTPLSEFAAISGEKFKAELSREEWIYALRENNAGYTVCDWFQTTIPSGTIEFDGSERELVLPVKHPGNYTLKILNAAGTEIHSRSFWHYCGETGTRSTNKTELSFSYDRESYLPGETAKVSFESPVKGSAVLFFGSEKIEGVKILQVAPGKNIAEVAIPENTMSGSRFFSLNICGNDVKNAVQRFFGVGVLPVNQKKHKILVTTKAPEIVRPGSKASVCVKLEDCDGNPVSGNVQLWAVDKGILSLTAFKTPDAFPHFFGTYACPYEFGDNYEDFYPQLALDKKLIGGGSFSALRKFLRENNNTEQSSVVVLDCVHVPASGTATVEMDVPDFDGGMRIMAFALNEEKTGAGNTDMIVRNPVALKVAAPRTLAPGDVFEVVGEVFNADSPIGEFHWRLSCAGTEVASGNTGILKPGEKYIVRNELKTGTQEGSATYVLEVFDASGKQLAAESVTVSVRSIIAPRDFVNIKKIQKGEEILFPNKDIFGSVEIGSLALGVSNAVAWLDDYPYGCLEQTVSGAFPLLATESLVRAGIVAPVFAEGSAEKIRVTLSDLASRVRYDGAYAMWKGGVETWNAGTLFAFHFELEADSAGFTMSERRKNEIRRFLSKFIAERNPESQRAYATYLLALAGDSEAYETAKRLFINSGDSELGFGRFLLASALIKSGHAAEGMKEIVRLAKSRFWELPEKDQSSCLDSSIRRAGMSLRILSEIAPEASINAEIARFLFSQIGKQGHWNSTQKNAWATLGLSAFLANDFTGTERALIKIDEQEAKFSSSVKVPGGRSVFIKNTGERPIYAFVRTRELPKNVEPISSGFEVSREYLNASGTPVASCESGDLLTVRIRVRADEHCPSAVICDLLPGGLEIEDETLLTRYRPTSGRIASSGNGCFYELARERRADRFLAFGTFYSSGKGSFAELTYRVRAISRGKFSVPPVQVESMYEGEKCAVGVPEDAVFEVK